MSNGSKLTFNRKAWAEMVKEIIDGEGVKRMKRVANSCNSGLPEHPEAEAPDNYMVSTEGSEPLSKRGYRATVITATGEAMRDNASKNTLVREFHKAGGS